MSWIKKDRPKIKTSSDEIKDVPDNLWISCPKCGEMIHHKDYKKLQNSCPKCGYHMMLLPSERFDILFDSAKYKVLPHPEVKEDPLKFTDLKKYSDRLAQQRSKTGEKDVIKSAIGKIDGQETVLSIFDFRFMAGSMGVATGEALVQAMKLAVSKKAPFVVFTASGGARMQESVLSLMQMVRTTVGVNMLDEAKLPYIVVFTDPTYGGVPASFAMVGDIHIAEKGARIGFAGRRVIEETNREKLPKEFQTAEFLKEKGMVDIVIDRQDMKSTLSNVMTLLLKAKK